MDGTGKMSSFSSSVETVARRVMISGQVQGVGFRQALAELARDLNVTGWCRNLADGRVEAFILGTKDAIAAMLDWMQKGPPSAVVHHVDVENQAVLEPMLGETIQTFEIRR
jgi:acylphosphatase